MPILNNILLEADEALTIKATNLEISIIIRENTEIVEKGDVCIPAKKIFEIVKLLPENDIIIEKSEKNLIIKSGKTNYKLFTFPTEDFPKIKTIEKQKKTIINKNDFVNSLSKVEYAIYPDESRESLNGVFIHMVDQKLRFVASDGFRLAYNEFNYNDKCEDMLISKKTVSELKKILSDSEGDDINFYLADNTLMIEYGNTTLVSRLKDAKFPNYKDVIPSNPYKLYVNKNDFLNTLKRISVISEENTKSVVLNIYENLVIVKSYNAEIGNAEDEISASYEGVPFEICYNAAFLIEAIEPIEAEKVELNLKDAGTAGVVSGDTFYRAVIMPIRLQ